jgi:hypothetical protein
MTEDGPLTPRDVDQLRMLVIGHYVLAGVQALFGCFPVIHLVVGILLVAKQDSLSHEPGGPHPAMIGGFFIAIALALMLVSWTIAGALVFGARKLARRERHVPCMVIAVVVAAVNMPLGTALGICTLIVLQRPSVKAAFEANG